MREAKTALEIIKTLEENGYQETFRACEQGLEAFPSKLLCDPKDISIDKFYRLEGETDLDEEVIIFALSCLRQNIKGIYQAAFGVMMDPLDAQIIDLLQNRAKKV